MAYNMIWINFAPMSNHWVKILVFTAFVVLFAACQPSQEDLLCKKWKTTNIYNTLLDKNIAQYKQLLDTVTEKYELVQYTGDLETFKKIIQADIDDMSEKQNSKNLNEDNSFLELSQNKRIYFKSVNGVDSANWYLEDNEIVADDEAFTGVSNLTRFTILRLDKENLKLRQIYQSDTIITTYKAATE